MDVEDNAFALMKNTKGQIAVLHSSATQWQHRFALEIYLSKGYIILNGLITGSKSYGEEKLIIGRRKEIDTGGDSEEVFTYLDDNSWSAEINEFAHAICNNKKIKYGTSKDALETMKTVYRIYWADPEWRRKYKIKNPN